MPFSKKNKYHTLHGILFVALFATSATYISEFSFFQNIGISPLIIAIILGMIYANSLRWHLPKEWGAGIIFSTKNLLRLAIIFYGFRLTFQNIAEVGISGILISSIIVITTFILGYIIWTKVLKLDRDITILTSAWSAICWAAAVLATEWVLQSKAYKSAIAVSTVVLFGTFAMFLYPYLYSQGFLDLDSSWMGMYIWWTLHEVAHVVAAWNALWDDVSQTAVIVKMIRVMILAPFLIIIGLWISSLVQNNKKKEKTKIMIPWFAVWFIAVAGFNSLDLLPKGLVDTINNIDTFILTMSMAALWMETSISKFKWVWMKPIYLATILFLWLLFWGYYITKLIMHL